MDKEYEGFCVRCSRKDKVPRKMKDVEITEIAGRGGSKRRAARGTCTDCGTKMIRFLPKEDPKE